MLPSPVRSSSRPLTRSTVIDPSPLRAIMLTSRGTDTIEPGARGLMEADAAEGFARGRLTSSSIRLPSCVLDDLQAVHRLLRRAPLLDVDGDFRLVPGLDLDGAVERRQVESGCRLP